MEASSKKIMDRLKAGKYDPVYLLQGEEVYFIDLISSYIESNALSESEKGFNQVVLYGKDSNVVAILNNAKRFPMMAERQVVIVREAQDIPDLNKEQGAKLMLDYFAKPVPSTVLVLCHKHKTLDKRKELGKKAEQLVTSATFKKLYENQLVEFVLDYCADKGQRIEEQAARLLVEYVGNDLSRLSNEIEKVLIGTEKGGMITANLVLDQVGISREYNIFELQKAIVSKDKLLAAKIVNYFEANPKKNPAIPAVAFLYSFFNKVMLSHGVGDKSSQGIAAALKISPFVAKEYLAASQRYPMSKTLDALNRLKDADLKLKGVGSGSEGDGQILKQLVFCILD